MAGPQSWQNFQNRSKDDLSIQSRDKQQALLLLSVYFCLVLSNEMPLFLGFRSKPKKPFPATVRDLWSRSTELLPKARSSMGVKQNRNIVTLWRRFHDRNPCVMQYLLIMDDRDSTIDQSRKSECVSSHAETKKYGHYPDPRWYCSFLGRK